MDPSWFRASVRYGNIGLELVISFFAGLLVGRWLDGRYFGGHGYATLVGTGIGLYAGFRSLWKLAKRAQREAEEEDARDREEADRRAKIDKFKRDVDAIEKDEEEERP